MLLAVVQHFTRAEVKRALRATVAWSVRGLIVGGLGGGTMEKAYSRAAVKIRSGEIKTADELGDELIKIMPSDSEFHAAFATARVTKMSLSRYYLNALERARIGQSEPELVPNTDEDQVNLEHVLPRKPTQSQWPEFTVEEVADWANRLGNHVLLKKTENARIGNKAFSDKAPVLARSSLMLTREAGEEASWTKQAIAARQSTLADFAVQVWPRTP